MNFTLLINSAPHTQSAYTAYQFAKTALAKKHRITRLFFYQDGVLNGNRFVAPPSDEINLVTAWQELAHAHNIELIICVAAATRRGVTEENLANGFKLSGLGQLIEAMINSDRFIQFG